MIVGPSGVGKSSLINMLRSDGQSPTLMEEGSLIDPVSFISLLFLESSHFLVLQVCEVEKVL